MSRMTVDIEGIRNFIVLGLLRALLTVVTFGAITVILFLLDPWLALITLTCVPLLAVLSIGVARRLRPLWRDVQQETGALGTVMQESLAGVRVVKAFAREEHEIEKFDRKNREVRKLSLDAMRMSAWNQPLMVLVLNVVTVAVLWVGGLGVIGHRLSLGTLVAVTQYAVLLAAPVRTFGFMVTWFTRGLSSGVRIFEVLDTPAGDRGRPRRGRACADGRAGALRGGGIRLWRGRARAGRNRDRCAARPGGRAAGRHRQRQEHHPAPAAALLRCHLRPDHRRWAGRARRSPWPRCAATSGWSCRMCSCSTPRCATTSPTAWRARREEQIMAAARAARVHEFAERLPDGYDTWVGERGVTLSGGQKQRVAIARTLLRDPRILVLDDATSSVDMETEYLIQQALESLMRGRTTFVVASRLRTIKSADQILVLDRGPDRGAGHPRHAAGAAAAHYARLYDLQLREQEEFETADRWRASGRAG